MFERQQAYEFLQTNEFEISALHQLPYIDISPLVGVNIPGLYFLSEDVTSMIRRATRQLEQQSPHPKGCSCVAISSDLRSLVSVRTPDRQQSINMDEPGQEDSLKNQTLREMTDSIEAANLAKQIAEAHFKGEISSAENLKAWLSKSSKPDLVRRQLKEMGRDTMEVIIDNQRLAIGGGQAFPATLASSTTHRAEMTITSGVDEKDQSTRVRLLKNAPQDRDIQPTGRSMAEVKLDFNDPKDGKALIAAQLAGCSVVAEISISYDSFSDKVATATLLEIHNREDIFSAAKKDISQLTFAF